MMRWLDVKAATAGSIRLLLVDKVRRAAYIGLAGARLAGSAIACLGASISVER